VPAELLGFAGRALAEHDVDQRRAAVVHRLVERALDVLWVFDKEALAAKGFHDLVVAGAVDQRVRRMLNIGFSGISPMSGLMQAYEPSSCSTAARSGGKAS
jgi:hypothetical protein